MPGRFRPVSVIGKYRCVLRDIGCTDGKAIKNCMKAENPVARGKPDWEGYLRTRLTLGGGGVHSQCVELGAGLGGFGGLRVALNEKPEFMDAGFFLRR